ncbi:MAG: DUF4886 domain-containing protein [Bacteroidota bacterium]
MKTIFAVLLIIFGVFPRLVTGQTKQVLFIGNSFTMNYDMPKKLEEIARQNDHSLYTKQVTTNGKDWKFHATQPSTYAKIRSTSWDYVFLQAKSYELIVSDSTVKRHSLPYGSQIVDSIRFHHPEAKIALFMTWGYEEGISLTDQNEEVDFEEMQRRIEHQYLALADTFKTAVVPVGKVWKEVRHETPELNLYTSDHYHQNKTGSFLIAATFYSFLFGEPIEHTENLPYHVTEQAARNILTQANNTVSNAPHNWKRQYWTNKKLILVDYKYNNDSIILTAEVPDDSRLRWKIDDETISKAQRIQLPLNCDLRKIRLIVRESIFRRPREETFYITKENAIE